MNDQVFDEKVEFFYSNLADQTLGDESPSHADVPFAVWVTRALASLTLCAGIAVSLPATVPPRVVVDRTAYGQPAGRRTPADPPDVVYKTAPDIDGMAKAMLNTPLADSVDHLL